MIEQKIEQLLSRLNEIEDVLAHSAVFSDQKKYRAITEEHAYLTEIKTTWDALASLDKQREDNRELLKVERDLDFAEVLREDIADIDKRHTELQEKLENILIPPDPNDHRNTIIEIRAGTGGDEAALFVGDCVRMYKLYADRNNWRYEPISCTESEVGGYKEYVMVLSGQNVFRFLQFEGGTHRVQRVPATEAQGRVHTSAITIAVIPEPDEDVDIVIDEKDLRVDTYRSSGAGGQHVNTTDSAVRITHMPSGIAVYCQEERSQHKNKDKAMRLLKAKLATAELEKKQAALSETRSSQVGSGDRSERIRTYNFPQNRLTDHRINLTKYNLDHIMDGDLDTITKSLVAHYRQEQLKS